MMINRTFQSSTTVGITSIPTAASLTSLANSIITNASLNNKINISSSNSPNKQPFKTNTGILSTIMASSNDSNNKTSNNSNQPIVKVSLSVQLLKPEKLYPTPSMNDNLPFDIEFDLRLIGCELIQTAGRLLKLPQTAMATGQVLYHRFFYIKSFVKNPMEYYAMASIFLSSKIEECPRRIRDVMNVFHHIKQVRMGKVIKPLQVDENYSETKNQVIKAERRILKELGFCVHVKHPHKIIFIYLQAMECSQMPNLSQRAWNYMNDSFRTDIFLRYSPENIVCACIYLSANESQISLPQNPPWFTIFGANEDTIKEICVRILHLYSHQTKTQEELEKIVTECRNQLNEEKKRVKEINNPTIAASDITKEVTKEENIKIETIIKPNIEIATQNKIQQKSRSSTSPKTHDPTNQYNNLNQYYMESHHIPPNHYNQLHHMPSQNYPIHPHSSHHSMIRNSSFNSYNYYHDNHHPHYMNVNDPYYNPNYHNENFYEASNLKRSKGSNYIKSSSQYKETEDYPQSKKRYSSSTRSDEKISDKERSSKISNQTNKYDYYRSKSRSRSKSPWKRKSNRSSRKRSKSRSIASNESDNNDHEVRSPNSNSKHKKKKSSHHSHRKEENKDSTHRNRHRDNDHRDKSRSRSPGRNHHHHSSKSSSSSKTTKHRSKDAESENNNESRYIPILS